MDFNAVYHEANDNYCYPFNNDELIINIKTGYDIKSVNIIIGDPFANGILGGGHAQKGEYADHPRVIQFQKVGWSDNYIEIIINTSEEDVEIAQKGEVLFARHYIDTALLCNGILIRRIKE